MVYNSCMVKSNKKNEEILRILGQFYRDAKPALEFQSPYQLLVAVLLSAQCTDARVNIVTGELFRAAPDAAAMNTLSREEIETIIKSCGLYKNKSKNIAALSKILMEEYGGEVPQERAALESLPGIGRKSANVVLSVAFHVPAIAVDTHVFRVSRRLGFSQAKNVLGVEKDLMELIPKADWSAAHHWLIFHGRRFCKAQRPECKNCPLYTVCPYEEKTKGRKEKK